jgi:hypothetical protein
MSHAGEGSPTLGFSSPAGGLEAVHADTLAELLGQHTPQSGGGDLSFVFLNGCTPRRAAMHDVVPRRHASRSTAPKILVDGRPGAAHRQGASCVRRAALRCDAWPTFGGDR